MIISVAKLRELIPDLAESDEALQGRLEALESLVRKYTNNNFQKRNIRTVGAITDGVLVFDHPYIKTDDTVEISASRYNNGVYTVGGDQKLYDEPVVLVTKVEYPKDVQLGVINLFKWDNTNRDKVGVQSESLSRHSVTYFNMDGDNSTMGYPKSLLGFLKPYMKARF